MGLKPEKSSTPSESLLSPRVVPSAGPGPERRRLGEMAESIGSIGGPAAFLPICDHRFNRKGGMSSVLKALAYGAASVGLYVALFLYAEELVELARRTRDGEKAWFIVPIAIAFVFSLVHGSFTAYFWDAIGLRPADKKKK